MRHWCIKWSIQAKVDGHFSGWPLIWKKFKEAGEVLGKNHSRLADPLLPSCDWHAINIPSAIQQYITDMTHECDMTDISCEFYSLWSSQWLTKQAHMADALRPLAYGGWPLLQLIQLTTMSNRWYSVGPSAANSDTTCFCIKPTYWRRLWWHQLMADLQTSI